MPTKKKKRLNRLSKIRKNHGWRALAITVLVAVLLLSGTYWFYNKHKDDNSKKEAAAYAAQEDNQQYTKIRITNVNTKKTYTSPNFGLSFTYPSDWIIKETSGKIIAESPDVYVGAITSQVVLTIRDKSQKLTEFDKGNATTVRDSVKIAYAHPTKNQRINTYLTYVKFPDARVGFDAIYVTGLDSYKKGEKVSSSDISKIDPVIKISFMKWGGPIEVLDSSLDDSNFIGPLKSIFESLTIN